MYIFYTQYYVHMYGVTKHIGSFPTLRHLPRPSSWASPLSPAITMPLPLKHPVCY